MLVAGERVTRGMNCFSRRHSRIQKGLTGPLRMRYTVIHALRGFSKLSRKFHQMKMWWLSSFYVLSPPDEGCSRALLLLDALNS